MLRGRAGSVLSWYTRRSGWRKPDVEPTTLVTAGSSTLKLGPIFNILSEGFPTRAAPQAMFDT